MPRPSEAGRKLALRRGGVLDHSEHALVLSGEPTCGAPEQLRAEGAQRIGLEVVVNNDHALGLYTSVGFTPVITEDYYALSIS